MLKGRFPSRISKNLSVMRTNYHIYTEAEIEWLRENQDKMTRAKLAEAFNEKFGASVNRDKLSDLCTKRLGLHRTSNEGCYGKRIKEQLPIGTIRKSQTGTYIKVADSQDAHVSGYKEPYWLPLQKKIYQDKFGEIGKEKMVCFLDGNTENFDINNLYPIDRRISAVMSSNQWWTKDREHTLTAIKWCELHYALQERNKNG